MERKSGVLLPIFSLPTRYGIGTFGKEAYEFVNYLRDTHQSYWQILPLNPTSYGDSPYQSFSTFALNPYFIDLDTLVEEGLLTNEELTEVDTPYSMYVDYGFIYSTRFKVLRKAFERAEEKGFFSSNEFNSFLEEEKEWLPLYALFMVLKNKFNGSSFQEWDEEYKNYQSESVRKAAIEEKDEILFYEFLQFKAFEQYLKLKAYANENGIKIIGDIPIYVALDSADVWGDPNNFLLGIDRKPTWVAGVPPDYFSEDGQLWGNPIYDYKYMEEHGFDWWKRRVKKASKIYDVLRIDHFRGMADYWAIPFGSTNAKPGHWVIGPNEKLVDAIKEAAGPMNIIAEDLGDLDETVYKLKAYSNWPGMKILQFGFDSHNPSDAFLPNNYEENCVAYLGTHDNETTVGFIQNHPNLQQYMCEILKVGPDRLLDGMRDELAKSRASLVIFTMQDILAYDNSTRFNVPSSLGGINWQFRLPKDYDTYESRFTLTNLVNISGRQ